MAYIPEIGEILVHGTDLYLIGQDNKRYKYTGNYVNKPTGVEIGSFWVSATTGDLHYIDANGNNRTIPRQTLTSVTGQSGSAWIESKMIHWINNNGVELVGHTNVAAQNKHSNIPFYNSSWPHSNTPFNDTHSNTPFTDNHGNVSFSDSHTNIPHGDHADQHGDCRSSGYGDNVDYENTPPVNTHSNTRFSDTHTNTPAHSNHSNTPHSNSPSGHSNTNFSDKHTNTPYGDSPVPA